MKKVILFSLASFLGSQAFAADFARSQCPKIIEKAKEEASIQRQRFAIGEVTMEEVMLAELNELDLRFDCRDITFGDYCQEAIPRSLRLVEATRENERIGQSEIIDVVRAEREHLVRENRCL